MPGKVNPVIPEVVLQVAAQVIGNDTAVTVAGTQGNFELNVRVPMMARNVFDSITLLTSASRLLAEKCVDGLEPNEENLRRHAESTPAIATALNPYIGYDLGTEIVQGGGESARTIREVAIEKGVDEETLDKALDLHAMARGSDTPSAEYAASAPAHGASTGGRSARVRFAVTRERRRRARQRAATVPPVTERLADRALARGSRRRAAAAAAHRRRSAPRATAARSPAWPPPAAGTAPGRSAPRSCAARSAGGARSRGRSSPRSRCACRRVTLSPDPGRDRRQVRVPGGVAEPVPDHHEVAVAARVPARELGHADARGADAGAGRHREVEPGVRAAALARRAEAVADRPGHRPQEPHRPAHRRGAAGRPPRCPTAPQRRRSCGTRQPVGATGRTRAGSSCRAVSVIGPNTASIAPGG